MKRYIFGGKSYPELPDPLYLPDGHSISPVNEATFLAFGGDIEDDGEPTPKEAVVASLNNLLHELGEQVDGVSVAEFRAAASVLHSGELVAFAREKGVSEEIIASARVRIVEILADALREGVTWAELVEGIRP